MNDQAPTSPEGKKHRDEATYERLLAEARSVRGVSLGRDAWRRLRRRPAPMLALFTLTLLGLLAVLTPALPLAPPRLIDTEQALEPPRVTPLWERAHWIVDGKIDEQLVDNGFGEMTGLNRWLLNLRVSLFGDRELAPVCGTDHLGRDVLARLFWGARISLVVGVVGALVSLVIGVSYGAISGYLGGRVDMIMMRVVDVLYSLPLIFVVILLLAMVSPGEEAAPPDAPAAAAEAAATSDAGMSRIMIFILVVGAIYWLTMARVVRGQVMSLKQEQFIEAARVIGASRRRIIFLHLVPNVLSIVIVYLTLTIPRVMLFEAFLSFLGLGVESPDVSWGMMASTGMREITPLGTHWWVVLSPGIALGVTLFALNFLGDGLRDALDPRLKNR